MIDTSHYSNGLKKDMHSALILCCTNTAYHDSLGIETLVFLMALGCHLADCLLITAWRLGQHSMDLNLFYPQIHLTPCTIHVWEQRKD